MKKFLLNKSSLFLLFCILGMGNVMGQISMTSSPTTYTENFDALDPNSPGTNVTWTNNTTIPGWYTNQTNYRSWNTGDAAPTNRFWSCGSSTASTDRALGSMMSSTTIRSWGVELTNNTGSTLNDLTIGLDAENYIVGGTGSDFLIQYSLSSTNVSDVFTSASWTTIATLSGATATGLSYSLSSLGLANGSTITIRFASKYSGSSSNYTLWATDNFTATWGPSNATPVINGQSFFKTPGTYAGSAIGTVAASDADVGQTLTYDIISNPGGLFSIDPSTGALTVTGTLAAGTTYTLVVEVCDNFSTPACASNIITINGNTTPVISAQTFTKSAGTYAGSAVGTVAASDAEVPASQTLTYNITSNPGGLFFINSSTGALTVTGTTVAGTNYPITVQVCDNWTPSACASNTITVTDASACAGTTVTKEFETYGLAHDGDNDVNSYGTYSTSSFGTASGGTVMNGSGSGWRGTYMTMAELGLTAGTYNIQVGWYDNDAAGTNSQFVFQIGTKTTPDNQPPNSVGTLAVDDSWYANGSPVGPYTRPIYTNRYLSATDKIYAYLNSADGSSSDQAWDFMKFTPVNTYAPEFTDPDDIFDFSIDECVVTGTSVGTAGPATDADPGQTVTYSIISGNTGGAFTIDPNTGAITTANTIDFETTPSYSLVVQATDNGAAPCTKTDLATVNINVGNLSDLANTNTPTMANQSFSINENNNFGATVGSVAASDADAGQALTYTITSGDPNNLFSINSATGQIIVNGALDHEIQPSYPLTVQVCDNGCPLHKCKTATVTINVNDLVEAGLGSCAGTALQGNLVTNGDFESAIDATYSGYSFVSDQTTGSGGPGTFTWSIPQSFRSSYIPATLNGVAADASGNSSGHYMLIDANDNTTAVWQSQPISVTAGVTYFFAAWIANINKSFKNPSKLAFYINGTLISAGVTIQADASDAEWSQYFTSWTAPSTTTVTLSFRNTSDDGTGSGDDMALDNVSFSGSCQFIDQYDVSQLPSDVEVCNGSAVTLNSQIPSGTFQWYKNGTAVGGATSASLTTATGTNAYGRYILCYSTTVGCYRTDTVDVNCTAPLPVEFMNFTGRKEGDANVLTWTTATEENNSFFVIERSSNGVDFVTVGTVQGRGNSSTPQTYIFNDLHPLNGTNYYRLKQVDFNAAFSYSNTIAIDNNQIDIEIYPNPNNGAFTITLLAPGESSYRLDITDVIGRVVYSNSGESVPVKVEVNNLAKGMYIVSFHIDDEAVIKKIIVY